MALGRPEWWPERLVRSGRGSGSLSFVLGGVIVACPLIDFVGVNETHFLLRLDDDLKGMKGSTTSLIVPAKEGPSPALRSLAPLCSNRHWHPRGSVTLPRVLLLHKARGDRQATFLRVY